MFLHVARHLIRIPKELYVSDNKGFESVVLMDLFALVLGIFTARIGLVLSSSSVIAPMLDGRCPAVTAIAITTQFTTDRRVVNTYDVANCPVTMTLPLQRGNAIPQALI